MNDKTVGPSKQGIRLRIGLSEPHPAGLAEAREIRPAIGGNGCLPQSLESNRPLIVGIRFSAPHHRATRPAVAPRMENQIGVRIPHARTTHQLFRASNHWKAPAAAATTLRAARNPADSGQSPTQKYPAARMQIDPETARTILPFRSMFGRMTLDSAVGFGLRIVARSAAPECEVPA